MQPVSSLMSWLLPSLLTLTLMVLAFDVPAAPSKAGPVGKRPQAATLPVGNPVWGKDKSEAERCQECHGVDGNGQGHANGPEGKFAKLAGQHVSYLTKQFLDFRSGARKHDQMAIMARSVADEDMVDILAYFANLPVMSGGGQIDPSRHAAAIRLYAEGDAARGVLSCASCHGPQGRGLPGLGPVIGGQEFRYLEKQLLDWRSGFRKNHEGGVMNQVVRPLTDAEILALAAYLSAL